jgi:hypothetical protein
MLRCFFFLAFVATVPLFGQETGYLTGFIVTNENDTIHGLVKNKNLAPYRILQDIKFKKDSDSKVEIYSPKDIKAFQAGPNSYVSKQYRENNAYRTSFVEVLIEGDMNFYELRITGLGTGNEIIYQMLQRKNEDYLFSVYGENFKERLLDYMKNEQALSDQIKEGKYKRNNIEELVKEYNLTKYIPEQSKTNKKRTITFYKRANNVKADLTLVFNDTLEYRVSDKYFMTIDIPLDVRTKVCFGTKTDKSCELMAALPYYGIPDYYELQTMGSKLKFDIEKRTKTQAQLHIAEKP